MDEIGADVLPSLPRLRAAMNHRAKPRPTWRVLSGCWLELKMRQYETAGASATRSRAGGPQALALADRPERCRPRGLEQPSLDRARSGADAVNAAIFWHVSSDCRSRIAIIGFWTRSRGARPARCAGRRGANPQKQARWRRALREIVAGIDDASNFGRSQVDIIRHRTASHSRAGQCGLGAMIPEKPSYEASHPHSGIVQVLGDECAGSNRIVLLLESGVVGDNPSSMRTAHMETLTSRPRPDA